MRFDGWFQIDVRGIRLVPPAVVLAAVLSGCGRSPRGFAEQVSGLDIPDGEVVVSFTDWSRVRASGGLFSEAVLEFDPEGFASLERQALVMGYIPVESDCAGEQDSYDEAGMSAHGFAEASAEISGPEAGLFLYRHDSPGSYSLPVLDPGRRRLLVRTIII